MVSLTRFLIPAFILNASVLIFCALAPSPAQAEPWLSTRYAQNCAGCHAPGRKNLPPADRRCTLSCQGCYVNSNGGGLRSYYGKWNEDRWLRSFRAKFLKQPKMVADFPNQHYGKKTKKPAKNPKRLEKVGYALVEVNDYIEDETIYDRRDGQEKVMATRKEFEEVVPQGDPYRSMTKFKIDGGGDIRFLAVKPTSGDDKDMRTFLMDLDFGLRYRPFRNTHVVYESRTFGSPAQTQIDETVLNDATMTRNLYVMQDDLPYNVFVMGGFYRPLFANYVPDHTEIAQVMMSQTLSGQSNAAKLQYKALSVGTAPNVPYGNFHIISKDMTTADKEDDKTSGFATNLGLRFVTLGASVNYSYWNTKNATDPDATIKVEMHSIGGALNWKRVTIGAEAVSMARDNTAQDFRQGGVMTLDTKVRLWRENYATFVVGKGNTALNLAPGSAEQTKVGLRSFVISGLDVSLVMDSTTNTLKGANVDGTDNVIKQSTIQTQIHSFF